MRSEPSLFQHLNDFALDDPSARFKFSNRLARENGWSLAFANGAIAEYKKFVYLAATSPTPITPSDIVDQVWHLHLTYSRSYWDEMCGEILKKPLHHGPTMGGASEDAKYRDLYAATLDAYRREFDEEAPPAFWPPADARFESAAHQRWVDTRENLVVRWSTVARVGAVGAGAFALSSAGAAFAATADKSSDMDLGILALSALAAIVFIFIGARNVRRSKDNGTASDGGGSIFIPGDSGHHGHGHHGSHDGGSGHSGCSGGGGGGGDGGGGCSGGGGGCSS